MQQFHTITHSFAQRRADYSSVFSRLRTLLLSIGGGGVSRALLLPPSHLAPLSPVPSLACAYFLSPRGGVPSTRFGFLSPQPQASRASSLQVSEQAPLRLFLHAQARRRILRSNDRDMVRQIVRHFRIELRGCLRLVDAILVLHGQRQRLFGLVRRESPGAQIF